MNPELLGLPQTLEIKSVQTNVQIQIQKRQLTASDDHTINIMQYLDNGLFRDKQC